MRGTHDSFKTFIPISAAWADQVPGVSRAAVDLGDGEEMKMRIPVPANWQMYSASYKWGFSEALRGKRERTQVQIGTVAATESYQAGYREGVLQRVKQDSIATRVTEEFA